MLVGIFAAGEQGIFGVVVIFRTCSEVGWMAGLVCDGLVSVVENLSVLHKAVRWCASLFFFDAMVLLVGGFSLHGYCGAIGIDKNSLSVVFGWLEHHSLEPGCDALIS